jgi:hypothetical protein
MRFGVWITLGAVLLAVRAAAAAAGPSSGVAAPSMPELRLVMVDGGTVAPPASLEARILSWFSTESLELGVERLPQLDTAGVLRGPETAGVSVWLLTRSVSQVRLFFAVRDSAEGNVRYLMTDVPLENGFDELGLEQIAQVAYLSAKALWEGRVESTRGQVEQGLSESSAPSSTPAVPTVAPSSTPRLPAASRSAPPSPDRPRARSFTLAPRTGVFYGARARGGEGAAHGPGATFALVAQSSELLLGGRLRAQVLVPHTSERGPIELDLRGYALTVGPWMQRRVYERTWVSAELHAGVDVLRFAPRARDGGSWKTSPAEWEPRPLLAASAGVHAELGFLQVGVVVQVAVQLLKTSYEVTEPAGTRELLTPWLVQPGGALEISW